ncbi:MAG: hypothetical protein R3B13_04330 [Polyangiaceae bacterium]
MSTGNGGPASALLVAHGVLDDVFALHQEALMLLDLDAAEAALSAYRRLLEVHMGHEESVLMEVFRRAGPMPKWPVVLYTGQHAKLLEQLARLEAMLQSLRGRQGREQRHAILELFDREATFKHLLEHHDGAEREGFFPTVDAQLTEEETRNTLPRLLDEWNERVREGKGEVDGIAQRLEARAARLV